MKLKSIPALFCAALAVLALVFAMSSPLSAQNQIRLETAALGKTASRPAETKQSFKKAPQTTAASRQSADDWFDKGALCATYGNDRAAIRYFKKALALDPGRSGPYFAQGISYGQLGEYDKALELVDKALRLEPENGLYHYGRGRVHLLAGKEDLALKDFRKAAELDDEDAQNYMDHLARLQAASAIE